MANPKYTVINFEQREPINVGPSAQGEWFYYEIGTNKTITLTGYRCGSEADVKRAINTILDRLNHDNSEINSNIGSASRLIFPTARNNEDGNIDDEDDDEIDSDTVED